MREYSNEPSNGKIFCFSYHEELNLKNIVITNHIRLKKHEKWKERLQEKATPEVDIAEALTKHNLKSIQETLPTCTQVFRVKVVMCFLHAGVPISFDLLLLLFLALLDGG